MIRSLSQRLSSRGARFVIASTTASALLLPTGLLTLTTAPSASAEGAVIDAIMGGGTVIGTKCEAGKVVELKSGDGITDFGPDTTLYVRTSGKTRLRRDSGYIWVNGSGTSNKDKVTFNSKETGSIEGTSHYLVGGTAGNQIAEFGTSSGGTASVIQGQGTHEMRFPSQTDGTVIWGTMFTGGLETYSFTYA